MQTTGACATPRAAHRVLSSLSRASSARLLLPWNWRQHRCFRSPAVLSSSGASALGTAHRALASSATRLCSASSSPPLFPPTPGERRAGIRNRDIGADSTTERLSDRRPGTQADTRGEDADAAGTHAELKDFDVTGASSSSSDGVPRVEPTSAAARAALEQRRALFASSTTLAEVVHAELHAEVARDMKDGVAAVPPLAPSGWRVLHSAGTSFFTMSRVLHGGYVERGVVRSGSGNTMEEPGSAASASPYSSPSDGLPRYRSVHDMMTGSSGGGRRSGGGGGDREPGARRTGGSAQATTQDLWVLRRGRYAAAEVTASDTDRDSGDGVGSSPPNRSSSPRRGGSAAVPCVARSDAHVTLFAPFRTLDLTLFDPRVDICEWTRFDVLVRKVRPTSTSTPSSVPSPLEGQQEVWDEGRCMFVRLACVNGELRLRTVQFLSHRLARALEEHAVFGKGEPLYLELLRRLSVVAEAGHGRGARTAGRPSSPTTKVSAASPVHLYDAPEAVTPLPAATAATISSAFTAADSASVLTAQFDRTGEYARTFAYGGPYLTDLSKELREALTEYVMMDLGIANEVAEYVCQLQYFLEQEEYTAWLAQWGQLAANLKRTL